MVLANSETQIVNSGLIKIGEKTITSLNQGTKAARYAKRQYPVLRDALLQRFRWTFAIRRTTLAPDTESPPFGFQYQHTLPDDCLQFLGFYDENEPQQNYTSTSVPHKIEGKKLLVDDDAADIFYVAEKTDPNDFDYLFSEALAWALAVDLAYELTAGPDIVAKAQAGFQQAIKDARVANSIQGSTEVIQASEWLDSRSGWGTYYRAGPIAW